MMTIEKLNAEFKKDNPTGFIQNGKKSKKFDVCFRRNSKMYSYTATSLVKLAEKLDMVPEVDVCELAEEIANRLRNGEENVMALPRACDTVRWILRDEIPEDMIVDCESYNDVHGLDDWNRQIGQYNIVKNRWGK